MANKIALTFISGKQYSAIILLLYNQQATRYRLRLVVHSDSSRDRLTKQYPQAEVLQANPTILQTTLELLMASWYCTMLAPTFHPHETELGQGMIDAACMEDSNPESKFSHFVLSSVLHTHVRKLKNTCASRRFN